MPIITLPRMAPCSAPGCVPPGTVLDTAVVTFQAELSPIALIPLPHFAQPSIEAVPDFFQPRPSVFLSVVSVAHRLAAGPYSVSHSIH